MVSYINGSFIDEKNAVIGIGDLAIQRGYGVFDFFRTRNFIPLFLDDYLDRFYRSAQSLRLDPLPERPKLKEVIYDLIEQNKIADSGFRMILTGGYSPDSFKPASPNLIIIQQSLEMPSQEKFQSGLRVILHEYIRDLPKTKSINYLMGISLLEKIRENRADEVLYYKENCILEFPRSNVFIVTKDNKVVTPSANVLDGITRMKVLEIAGKEYETEERDIPVEELMNAAEIFLTSTTKRILPVLKVDEQVISNGRPGEITTSLYKSFLQLEEKWVK